MRCLIRACLTVTRALAAGALLGALGAPVGAQLVTPDYTLTAPTWMLPTPAWTDAELSPRRPLGAWGPLRVATTGSSSGSGLSVEAGEKWFARAGLGRSLDNGMLSLGAGYRFAAGEALSMQVMRQMGQERLGLAVRYDWQRSYLRLSYEQPLRTAPGSADLRFSAGMRF
jgi:hypothetical protein